MTLARTRDSRLLPRRVTWNRVHSRLPSEARHAEGEEEEEEEGVPVGVRRVLGPRASASTVSLLPAVVPATVPIQMEMDRTCVRGARRLHLRQVERHHARGLDLHSEEGDLRGRISVSL